MKPLATFICTALIACFAACANLMADTFYVPDLPPGDTDALSIALNPANGAGDGVAGASVGWGFTVTWTSTNGDWISFTSSSLGSVAQGETNPMLLASYSDFIGPQGGPLDFGLSPGASPWAQSFDGVSQGAGLYQITSDPSVAVPGAEDTGQITFDFQVFDGDPLSSSQIGDGSYSYYGSSTAFSVTVDPPSSVPEPASLVLLASALVKVLATRRGTLGATTPAALALCRS